MRYLSLLALAAFLPGLTGCLQDKCDRTQSFVRYDPVYLTVDEMRAQTVSSGPARELQSPGNINKYGNYILINERLEGVHVIDNTNPSSPVNVSFIEIPGNRDIAVRNGILYADMYIDLVAVDISNINAPQLLCREEGVFTNFYPDAGTLGHVVDYIPSNEVIQVDCSNDNFSNWWWRRNDVIFFSVDAQFDSFADPSDFRGTGAESSNGSTGIAGSMSRFTLVSGHLYTLDQVEMHVFSLAGSCPSKEASVQMQWGIETLFPYEEYLFVGSMNGMLIYDNSNPAAPQYVSQFSHAQACDPVFVSEDVAYVTLRNGTECLNFINQLDVVDVRNITSPQLIRTYPMEHPHGLSVVDKTLYLCEGAHGVKVFDVTDREKISDNRLSHITGIHAFDVIVSGDVALVIGGDGFYQYNIADAEKPELLSKIAIAE